jgi:DNA-binding transcriptional LysR family regulator
MIDFRLLRHFWYFLAVAEENHFGKAAKRLGMSQPPLSQQIQILEKSLGIKLFERSRHGIRLTKEGNDILGPVQRFMEHAQRLQLSVLDARQGRSDSVSIGAINSALFDILPKLMRRTKEHFPALSVSFQEMKSFDALSAVRDGEIDIALARFDDQVPDLEIKPLIHDHLVAVLPIDHRLTKFDRVNISDLVNESLVLFPRRASPSFFDQITSACRAQGFSPQVRYEVSNVVSQIAYVGCGAGIGLVPSRSMRFGGTDVVFRSLTPTIEVVTIAAAWDPSRGKDVVPAIINIACTVGDEMQKLPLPRRTAPDLMPVA